MKAFHVLGAVALLGAAAACGDRPTPEPDAPPPPPTAADLATARVTLSGLDSAAATLVEGVGVAGDGTRLTLLPAYVATGDFDADGADETAVIVLGEPGGTGVFVNLVGFRRGPEGGAVQIADILLGDRQQIHRFETVADSLLLEITTHGPSDPMCCPTRRAERAYLIRDGAWRLWRDNTLSAAPPDIQDGVIRRDSTLARPGPVRDRAAG